MLTLHTVHLFNNVFIIYLLYFCKIKWYEARLIISNVHRSSFFSISICVSAVSFFIASLCPPIYGAAFDRMFTSRCLCTIIRHGRINLSLYRIDVLCNPFRYFVLLNCNCSLEALNISTCIGKVINSIDFRLVSICSEGAISSLL